MRTPPPASLDHRRHCSPSTSAQRTTNRKATMSHILYRIGNFAGRHPWRVISAWALLTVTVFTLNAWQGGHYDETFTLPGSESQRAADAIQEALPAGERRTPPTSSSTPTRASPALRHGR